MTATGEQKLHKYIISPCEIDIAYSLNHRNPEMQVRKINLFTCPSVFNLHNFQQVFCCCCWQVEKQIVQEKFNEDLLLANSTFLCTMHHCGCRKHWLEKVHFPPLCIFCQYSLTFYWPRLMKPLQQRIWYQYCSYAALRGKDEVCMWVCAWNCVYLQHNY